jgi:hypothetical protein
MAKVVAQSQKTQAKHYDPFISQRGSGRLATSDHSRNVSIQTTPDLPSPERAGLLPGAVLHQEGSINILDSPRRREAAFCHQLRQCDQQKNDETVKKTNALGLKRAARSSEVG